MKLQFAIYYMIGIDPEASMPSITDRKLNSQKGFTLTELLVGMGIFILILGGVMGSLIAGLKMQRRLLAKQQVLEELSFNMEFMSRALRMAKEENGDGCLFDGDGHNYENRRPTGDRDDAAIRFINHIEGDDCQGFFLEGNTLKYYKEAIWTDTLDLTSPNVEVQQLEFYIEGAEQGDSQQARVTILLKAQPQGFASPLILQTTISQRILDEDG